jgi:hypothetical protein
MAAKEMTFVNKFLTETKQTEIISAITSLEQIHSTSTKRITHHFGVGTVLFDEIKKWCSEKTEVTDIFWDTKDFILIRQNVWLRSRNIKESKQSQSVTWSLKLCSEQKSKGEFDYFEENDPTKIIEILSKALPKKYPDEKDIDEIFMLYPKSAIASTRISFHTTNVRIHVDCFTIGNEPFVLGGISFKVDDKDENLINLLKDSKGYIPNVRSRVIEDIALRYPVIFKGLQDKGFINGKITFSHEHQYNSPLPLPVSEKF